MKNKNSENKAFTKRWFYIAVGFGLFFTIITTFIAICRNLSTNETSQILNKEFTETENKKTDVEKDENFKFEDTQKQEQNKNNLKDEETTFSKTETEDDEDDEKSEEKAQKTSATPNKPAKNNNFISPVEGKIIQADSKNKPVFWETVNDWRTHNAVDIAAKKNTAVKSIAKGTVVDIKNEDNTWGFCVTIEHDNGFKSIYTGLSEQLEVKLQDKVKAGDVIGRVGTTNHMENKLGEHLHFILQKDDLPVDPEKYIKFNQY